MALGTTNDARGGLNLAESHLRAWLSRPHLSHLSGAAAGQGWDARTFAPKPGNLVMMPGYFHHRTRRTESHGERICLVFDIVPVELAETSPSGA